MTPTEFPTRRAELWRVVRHANLLRRARRFGRLRERAELDAWLRSMWTTS